MSNNLANRLNYNFFSKCGKCQLFSIITNYFTKNIDIHKNNNNFVYFNCGIWYY